MVQFRQKIYKNIWGSKLFHTKLIYLLSFARFVHTWISCIKVVMAYRLQLGEREQAKQMNSFMEQWSVEHMPDLLLTSSDANASLPTHAFLFSFHSPFLRSVFKSVNNNKDDLALSLPFTASCLEKLLELLTQGLVVADSNEQLMEVKEAANALGFSLDDSDVVAVTANKCGGWDKDSLDVKSFIETLREASLPCDECGKKYKNLESLQKHTKKKHNIQPLEEKKPFKEEEGLEARFSCTACPKIFSRRAKLEIHTKKYHIETEDKHLVDSVTGETNKYGSGDKLTCNFCPKTFTCRKHQHRHMSSVHSTKVISCEHCGKQFSRGDHLRGHMKTAHLIV